MYSPTHNTHRKHMCKCTHTQMNTIILYIIHRLTIHIGFDKVTDILKELSGLESEFESLAMRLHLPFKTLKIIKTDYYSSTRSAFVQVITEWVILNYNHTKFGKPSWKSLVKAVDFMDHKRAKQIATKHKKVSAYNYYLDSGL